MRSYDLTRTMILSERYDVTDTRQGNTMTRAKLTAKLNAIAKLLEETKAAVTAIPADVDSAASYRFEDMDTELAEVIACLRSVRNEARDTIEVYA